MTSGPPGAIKTLGWATRLRYGLLAAGAAWLAGWLAGFPFELSLAWRYVDGNPRRLPSTLAEGLLVWAGFTLFMAAAGFVPLVLPPLLLIPARWIVRWRRILIPAAPLGAILAIDRRMGLLHVYRFQHPQDLEAFFFTAPNFFVVTFALVVVWVYVVLAAAALGRLEST